MTAKQVKEYAEVHYKRLFQVKTYREIEIELEKIRKKNVDEKSSGKDNDNQDKGNGSEGQAAE